jgi:hypothetical protein
LNLNICCKQYHKIDLLHQIVVPQKGWPHNYSNKPRQAGCANDLNICSLLSMVEHRGLIGSATKIKAIIAMNLVTPKAEVQQA